MSILLRIITFGCLIAVGTSAFAQKQSYDRAIRKIDYLASDNKAKEALLYIDALTERARKDGNTTMFLKSIMYRMLFQNYLDPTAQAKQIMELRNDVASAAQPAKSILHSLLGQSYWQYYLANRYRISQRTLVNAIPGDDVSTWSIKNLTDEIVRQYLASLSDKKILQDTKIAEIKQVLVGDTTTRHMRPTIYDLLAHRALEIFQNTQMEVSRPGPDPISFDNRLFTDVQTFSSLTFPADSNSFKLKTLNIFQELLRLHQISGNLAAMADADLKRLKYVYEISTQPNKAKLFFEALQKLLPTATGTDIYSDILYEQAILYKTNQVNLTDDSNLMKALALAQEAIRSRPKSPGAQNAAMIEKQIKSKALTLEMRTEISPKHPTQLLINYTNIQTAYLRLFKIPSSSEQSEIFKNKATYLKFLTSQKSVRDWKIELPVSDDYQPHTYEDYLDGLPLGKYLLVSQTKAEIDTLDDNFLNNYTTFRVTGMGVTYRTSNHYTHEYIVRDNIHGKPLQYVQVTEFERINNNQIIAKGALYTNANGYTSSDSLGGVTRARITLGRDTLSVNVNSGYRADINAYKRVILFTDRSIYRPGQTVYYKGLYLQQTENKNDILPNQKVKVEFIDVNYEDINEQTHVTNEFGTFHGHFEIPIGKLNGLMQITTEYGQIGIQVEEYKRPTFEVKFDPPREHYKLGDSIQIKGMTSSFAGYQIAHANVRYTVYQSDQMHSRFTPANPNTPIAAGMTQTNSNGSFSLKFFAPKNNSAEANNSSFLVKVEVTDPSGETRLAERNFLASEKDLVLNTALPEFLFLNKTQDTIQASIQNLNGQPIKAGLKVEWFPMTAPSRLTHKRTLSGLPEKYRLDSISFRKLFPYETYKEEDNTGKWLVHKTAVLKQNITTESGTAALALDQNALKSGYYTVRFSAFNAHKDTVSTESIIRIYNEKHEQILNMGEWLRAEKTTITPNEQAIFRIAGMNPDAQVYYEVYNGSQTTEKVWIPVNAMQTTVKISPKVGYERNFAVQFTMIQQGITYTSLQHVNLQDDRKELDIKFLSFRNKLEPGESEKWKLKISSKSGEKKMAEMVATLYDASLDALKPTTWSQIQPPRIYRDYSWSTNLGATIYSINFRFSRQLPGYGYRTYIREYETITSYLVPFTRSATDAYYRYLDAVESNLQRDDSLKRLTKLALLKRGNKVFGVIRDEFGSAIREAQITAGSLYTKSDRLGIYQIEANEGNIIRVSAIGHTKLSVKLKPGQKQMDFTLKGNSDKLQEVVIRGYTKRSREVTTGSSYIANVEQLLQGKVAGLNISGDEKRYEMAPNNSTTNTGEFISNQRKLNNLSKITTRTNFNETAFFFPELRTDENGEITIEFEIPESLTRFKMLGFAHTKDLMNTVVSNELITQKQFSIAANTPRFFREGDTILLNAKLNNLSGKKLTGNAALQLTDALTGKPINIFLTNSKASAMQKFRITDQNSETLQWPLVIPAGINAITYKVVAESGKYSDGEEMTIPILSNRMLVTETMPLNVRGNTSKIFNMDRLLTSGQSSTMRHHSYTLEFTSNPAWYAIQSLPYLMEYPYECAEQTFSRFYANSFSSAIANSSPKIAEVFRQWKELDNSQAFLSNLEKNQELKSILIEETPYVRNATSESEQKKRLGTLFDLNRMSAELKSNFERLSNMQNANGSFPWFTGMGENRYITQHIVLGMTQMKKLKVVDLNAHPDFDILLNKAVIYLDQKLKEDYVNAKSEPVLDYLSLHYLYARSYGQQINTDETFNKALQYYLGKVKTSWTSLSLYQQSLAALVLSRNGLTAEAKKIVTSLKERAHNTEEMGMFWPENTAGWWWYQSSVETQAILIEVFDEIASDSVAVEEMKIWLLKNKQTTHWKTTKATTAACYALLMRGANLLLESTEPEILLGDQTLAQLGVPEPPKEAGTGYRKISLEAAQVKSELGKVTIKNNSKSIAWGGAYWQYFEQLDKITAASTGVKIIKQLFVQEESTSGKKLQPLSATKVLKPGDLIKVRIEIYADRDMEYLHLKDMRSSGFEPVNVISTYKYQDGLGYYESTKDASTNFFIDFMRKGTYVFEYPLRVSHAGNFSNGNATLQSMYAPEFTTHSQGIRVTVKP